MCRPKISIKFGVIIVVIMMMMKIKSITFRIRFLLKVLQILFITLYLCICLNDGLFLCSW